MTPPAGIIDRVAAQRGLVTPVPGHFPLNREFVEAVIRDRDAQWEKLFNELRERREETTMSVIHNNNTTVTLVRITCGECGIAFGVPEAWDRKSSILTPKASAIRSHVDERGSGRLKALVMFGGAMPVRRAKPARLMPLASISNSILFGSRGISRRRAAISGGALGGHSLASRQLDRIGDGGWVIDWDQEGDRRRRRFVLVRVVSVGQSLARRIDIEVPYAMRGTRGKFAVSRCITLPRLERAVFVGWGDRHAAKDMAGRVADPAFRQRPEVTLHDIGERSTLKTFVLMTPRAIGNICENLDLRLHSLHLRLRCFVIPIDDSRMLSHRITTSSPVCNFVDDRKKDG